MQLTISTNFADVQRKLDALRSDIRDTVLVRTLNRTIEGARTDMSKEIRKEFVVTAGYVRERLKIRKASFRSGRISFVAELSGGGRKVNRSANLIAFGAREVAKGVSVKIKRVGGRQVLTGAFIGNKGRTVFTRVPNTVMQTRQKYRDAPKHANKIKPLQTVDVAQMFNTKRINAAVIRAIETKLRGIFERESAYALSRFAK